MIIRVLPTQVPALWEAIKFAVVKVGEVKADHYQRVFSYVLHKLLNDKAQCWVKLTEERELAALTITEIQINKITGDKVFAPLIWYSWRPAGEDEWMKNFIFIKEFAEKQQCKQIVVESSNPRMWQLYDLWGFKESIRRFTLEVS